MIFFALVLSILGGVFFGVFFPLGMRLFGVLLDAQTSLMAGLLFGGMCFPALLLLFRHQVRRYQAAEDRLPSPCTDRFSAMLHEGKQPQALGMFLCEDCLCLVDLDKKAMPMTVYPCEELVRAVLSAPNQLELHLTEGRCLHLRTGHAQELLAALKERGWLPFQH